VDEKETFTTMFFKLFMVEKIEEICE